LLSRRRRHSPPTGLKLSNAAAPAPAAARDMATACRIKTTTDVIIHEKETPNDVTSSTTATKKTKEREQKQIKSDSSHQTKHSNSKVSSRRYFF
jgi:hypothetical protein